MNGQWINFNYGSNEGLIIINIADRNSHYEGIAYLIEFNRKRLSTMAFFSTQNKDNEFQLRTHTLLPINPATRLAEPWGKISPFYNNLEDHNPTSFPEYADIQESWNDTILNLSWTTNIGTYGHCAFSKSRADQPSELAPLNQDWTTYKEYVSNLEGRRYLFRGQNKPWRLRTSFHRTGRANLRRFLNEDIPGFYTNISVQQQGMSSICKSPTKMVHFST